MRKQGVSRREFIKRSAGVAGFLALLASPAATVLARNKASAEMAQETPDKKHRAWCMVIDLRKCDGCVTIGTVPQCTSACVTGHFVPKGQQWIEVFEGDLEGGGSYFLPTPCYQCENAPCVNVCPVAATYHDESGVVLIDHRRCIGCRLCMSACPYQRRFFNWGEPILPPEAAFAEYSPHYPVPAVKGTVIKCMFCVHFLVNGKLPFCVTGCPMKAIYMGDLNEDLASNGQDVVKLSAFLNDNDAFRYKEELGTKPRVFYIKGHGQSFGRTPTDLRPFKPMTWPWGDETSGFKKPAGIFPWSETK